LNKDQLYGKILVQYLLMFTLREPG
jgi:hypothetical protein